MRRSTDRAPGLIFPPDVARRGAEMTDLSILMSAYNEESTVERAIERVLAATYPVEQYELVVVDNGSTDRTGEVLRSREWPSQVRIVRVEQNRGKGDGVRRALKEAGGRYSVILDADLEYDPAEIGSLLEPLLAGDATAVFGTRVFQSHSAYGFWYVLGNRVINLTANVLFNAWVSDILNCLKAMPTDVFRSLELREHGFGIDAEIPARLLSRGAVIYEVPVTYRARKREEGKKLSAMDGVRILRTLLRCRLA
jgi:glycosyltransferase involved in cell wall biosynthesis